MTDSLHRSLYRLGTPTISGSLHRSYVRTYVQTHKDFYSPTSESFSSVTHARAYEIEVCR